MNALSRFAFGRPITEDRAAPQVAARPATALVGRLFLATIFILSGINKFAQYAATVGYAEANGLPYADVLVPIAGVVEIAGGLSILTGFLTRFGALALMGFLAVAAYFFHDFWTLSGAERQAQMSHFLKNLAIFGGMLLLVAHGAGRYSIDRVIRKRVH